MSATHVMLSQPNLVAGGTINRGRFITLSTSVAQTATQAATSTIIIAGVTTRWSEPAGLNAGLVDGFGTVVARSGEPVPYAGAGQIAELKLGTGGVTNPSIPLTTDANGCGIAASSGDFIGALALRLGSVDEYIPVYVLPPGIKY